MTSPRKFGLLLATALCAPAASAMSQQACSGAVPNYAATAGGFGTIGSRIYTPDGTLFVPDGINVMEGNEPSAAEILAQFPHTNFVRLAIFDFASAASLKPLIDDYTSHGIFVEIEDHSSSDSQNRGGSTGVIYQGALLQKELAWFGDVGGAFKTNPYVGYGTNNEPSLINPATGQNDPAALSAWQKQTYDAIRATGNNNPIWLETASWGPGKTNVGFDPAAYAKMTNVRWDQHVYPWVFPADVTASQAVSIIGQMAAEAQQIKSADGVIPVDVLEYGNSTTGVAIDGNWKPVVDAVHASGLGTAAWAWGMGNPGDGLANNSTSYGADVAAHIVAGGAPGCPQSPIPAALTGAAIDAANAAVTAANNLSVADVAALAAQGTAPGEQAIGNIAQTAATGVAGAVLPTDATTAAVLAEGPVQTVQPIVRTAASPSGTMPAPAPASGTTYFSASGDYETVVPRPGNATGTISGTGNTVNAIGGIQAITVTGAGNTLTSGPYNDTVTVQSSGNTIDTGGGNDTVVLAYSGKTPSTVINQDAPAVTSLGSAGNTIILPAPGTGTVTIAGILSTADRLDLSKALAGTTWDHQQSTLWNYVDASATSSGCTISVGGRVIALIPGGSPNGNIGPFITAH